MHDRDHRLSLLGRVSSELARAGISHALIGAAALALHGVSRSTYDLDLLAVERSCLDPESWTQLSRSGIAVEVRRGDLDDPLAGVVRFTAPAERPVDLVVGRAGWQADALARAANQVFAGVDLPVLRAPDLILAKLYAGGPQDAWDVAQLLAAGEEEKLCAEVEKHIGELPTASIDLWRRIRNENRA
jgi:hypothetical protein